MMIMYRLEIYHWEGDYWQVVGNFVEKEQAEEIRKQIEAINDGVLGHVFEVIVL